MFVVVDAVVVELSAVIRDKNHQLTGRVRGVAVVMITVVMFMVLVVLLVLECLCMYIRVCVCVCVCVYVAMARARRRSQGTQKARFGVIDAMVTSVTIRVGIPYYAVVYSHQ